MVRPASLTLLSALCILSLLLLNCATINGAPQEDGLITSVGTVSFVDLEGGFYGIQADNGKRYDPLNLSEPYQKAGLRIRFKARLRKDTIGYHMWGESIEILEIERLE